ncbi:MAG TPA: hypothetical protein VHL11_13045 [Phototrophicaceae bacterium]|jgi:hypothetical protein|nr:hypothetical protein [Phototrophicaceae bacterium]
MASGYYTDKTLQTIFDFDDQDLELNREELFSIRQKEHIKQLLRAPNGCFYLPVAFMTGIVAVSALCSLADWDDFVIIEAAILICSLLGSGWVRLSHYLNVRNIIVGGIRSETGILKPVVDQKGIFRPTTIQIGNRNFTVSEEKQQEVVQLINETGPVYYRVYYPRLHPDVLLSIERMI